MAFVPLIVLVRPLNRALYHKLLHAVVGARAAHARSALRPSARAPDARRARRAAAMWCTVCLALPERVNGVRVRISGTVRSHVHSALKSA